MFSLKTWVRRLQASRQPRRTPISRSPDRRSSLALTPLEDRTVPSTFTTTSPTSGGALPSGVTQVGGIVLDIVGANGARVVSQLPASSLHQGFAAVNPLTIGTQTGFTSTVVNALGGGISELAVRITLLDGDTGPSNFDENQNTLLLNNLNFGNFSDVATQRTSNDGLSVLSSNPSGGFRDSLLDTGFFYTTNSSLLSSFYNTLGGGQVTFAVNDPNTPGDNFYDFTAGVDGGLVNVGQPPNVAPIIQSVTNNGPISEGGTATVTVSATDPDATTGGLTYEFDLDNNGTYEVSNTTGVAQRIYTENGNYTVNVRVSDTRGGVDLGQTVVAVNNAPPTITAVNVPGSANEGAAVGMSAAATDPAGAADPLTYSWSFGDGSPADTGPSVSHTYADNGPYTVTLTVTDGDGGTAITTRAIAVANVAPALAISGPGTSVEALNYTLNLSASDPGADTIQQWVINWGDGNTQTVPGNPSSVGHTYADNGTYAVTATATDEDGTYAAAGGLLQVNGLALAGDIGSTSFNNATSATFSPVVASQLTLTTPGIAHSHGGSVNLALEVHNPVTGTWTAIDSRTLTGGASFSYNGLTANFPQQPVDQIRLLSSPGQNQTYHSWVSLSLSLRGGEVVVQVANANPTVSQVAAGAVRQEGVPVSVTVDAADPAGPADPLSYEFDFDNNGTYEVGPQAGPSAPHTFGDDGTYTVNVRVTDGDGGVALGSSTFVVANVNPVIAGVTAPTAADEAQGVAFSAVATDVPADALTYTWNFGDGSPADTGAGVSHAYADNGTYTVTLTVTDGDGGSATTTRTVVVNNVAPIAGAIVAPVEPVAVGTAISTSATFADVGVLDTHTATWDWGDNTTSAGAVSESGGSGSVAGSHTYAAAGVYTVKLTVTDKDTGSSESFFRYVVVYDPSAGFVTGGGWIDSPAGAYAADSTLSGKANFGFVSKYQRGATTPTGQTEFQFKAGGFNFHSSSYDWLVVGGAKAQYKGTGTVNGSGSYKFLLSAIDGQRPGGGGADKFRIKIWDAATEAVVYDNQMGLADDGNPTTALGGGSIKIHS